MNDLLEAKADIKKAVQKKEQPAQSFLENGLKKEYDQAMLEGKTVVLPASRTHEEAGEAHDDGPRRRRQQKSLQLIKSNQAK